MKEAILYERLEKTQGSVKCSLCAHRCIIPNEKVGICGVRKNISGKLYSLVYGKACAVNIDPIEKKPLFHYLPGTMSYSFSTVGCNFRCQNCQNWDISQVTKGEGAEIFGRDLSPEEIVESAVRTKCRSISYTYTEPTIFMEYALDTAKLAKEKNIGNVFVSNGYMTKEAIDVIKPYLNADNVDIKSFSDDFYKKNCGGRLQPVLDTCKELIKNNIWVEITTLIIPTLNDSESELRQIAEFIKNELGEDVPWHVSRFHPDYKLLNIDATPMSTIRRAREIGFEVGLHYVYAGNIPHENTENTYCPKCKKMLIERYGFEIMKNIIKDSKCPYCGFEISGVWS